MKFDIKSTLIFFVILTLFGMLVQFIYNTVQGDEFYFPLRTLVFYAVFSIGYGIIKTRRSSQE